MAQRTIIYAEDDKAQRESMTELLEMYGFQVRPHANGKLALDDIISLQAAGAVDRFLYKPVIGSVLKETIKSISAKHDMLANPNTPLDFVSRASDMEMMR